MIKKSKKPLTFSQKNLIAVLTDVDNTGELKADFYAAMKIHHEDLNGDMSDQGGHLARFNLLYVKAKYDYEKAKESLKHKVKVRSFNAWHGESTRFPTEMAKIFAEAREDTAQLEREMLRKEYIMDVYEYLGNAIAERGRMLIGLDANARQEKKSYK